MPRNVQADDFYNITMVADPQLSPDGSQVLFVKRFIDRDKQKYRSQLWLKQVGAGPARQFTGAASSDGGARWSPDGTQIAFLSDRTKPESQIFVISAAGGEARPLTSNTTEGGFTALNWSPDGSKIAFLFRKTPEAYTKKASEERKAKELPAPVRVHKKMNYRGDGFGYYDGEFWQLGVANSATGEVTILTTGDYDCGAPQWSPDGTTLAFISDRNEDSDLIPGRDFIYTISASGGELTEVPTPIGYKGGLSWSPDGKWFAYLGNTDIGDPWGTRNTRVLLLPSAGGETAADLTGHSDISAGYLTLSDVHESGAGDSFHWSADCSTLYFVMSSFGDTYLCSVPITGGEVKSLSPELHELGGFSYSPVTGALVATLATPVKPQELYLLGADAPEPLTDFNASWLSEVSVLEPLPFSPDNGEGGTVPGWILKPQDASADKKCPLVLYIHGGPHAQYGNTLFHELQWLAAEGYVVLYTNPRGSKGYGEEHTRAIWGDWGGPDYRDLIAAVDQAEKLPYVDASKTAVMGGSYGGYMTALIVGRTGRFTCAIADRLVANRHSMSGTTDFAWRHDVYFKGNSWDNPGPLLDCSPLSLAGYVTTPLLLIHSDGDLRCPISQAEDLFAALRLQRKTVEFVRYPAETSHGMSRNGPPTLRLDRLERNLEWLKRYLN